MTDIEKIIYDAIHIVAKTDEPEKFAQMNKTVFEVAKTVLESLPKVHGWVARDKSGSLNLHSFPPRRVYPGIWCYNPLDLNQDNIRLDDKILPEITWESEPVEVELLVRRV